MSLAMVLYRRLIPAAILGLLAVPASGVEVVEDTPGSYSFTVPEGVTEITVEVWGGGGRGGDRGASPGGSGGGGGGGYASATISVEEGDVYDYEVGAGSTTADPGGASTVTDPGGSLVVQGEGGQSVDDSVASGAGGGGGTGDDVFVGGGGGDGVSAGFLDLDSQGGGGGSSAGPGTDGDDGQTPQGAAGPTGDGDSGDGGDGADGSGTGADGAAPGGGGGGAARCALICGAEAGGAGGDGRVRITYDGPAPTSGLLMSYWFDEDWTDTDTIPDQSGEGRDGFSGGAAYSPAGSDSARPGDPGTCGFAEIDGPDNVVAPVDDEVNSRDSFTTTFWMRMDEDDQDDEAPSIMAVGELDGFFARRAEVLADFQGTNRDLVFFVRQGRPNNPRERTLRWETSPGDSNDPFAGEWVHIGVRHDMDSRLLEIYANGSLVASDNYGNQGPDGLVEANDDIQIGGFSGGTAPAVLDFDEFRYYGEVLSGSGISDLYSEDRSCDSGLAGFEITVPASASVCEAAPVSVAALDGNGDVITDYTGDINLTTSADHGNWSLQDAEGSLDPDPHTADDGAASYGFVEADDGEAVFGLSNERADELTVTATDPDADVSSTSDPMRFQENAFAINIRDDLGNDVVAGRDHAIELEALRRDPDTGECGRVTAYDGTIGLKAWIDRSSEDPGGDAPALSGPADTASMPDSPPGDDNIDVNFDNGLAELEWQTSDVGQHALNVLDDSSGLVVDANGDPVPVSGSGAQWTVRPFGFDVSIADNPAASGSGGSAFRAAGRPFEVTARAVTWQSADDSDDDGQPDGHADPDPEDRADLSDNDAAAAFGASDPSAALSSTLVAGPGSPSDPGLSDAETLDAFSGGEDSGEARFEEVGSIAVLADLGGSYLGRSASVIGHSDYVGRFHPELFSVTESDGSFDDECNGFVYVGQDFGYDLAPELEIIPRGYVASGTGPLLNNYRGDWRRLEASDVVRDFPQEDDDNSLDVSVSDVTGTLDGLGDGRMEYLFGADEYRYTKDQDSRVAPFDTALTTAITTIDDGDAQLDPEQSPSGGDPLSVTPDPVEARYGRLRLDNAYGPETRDLILPMRAEYWDGDAFVLNTEEGCWTYNTSDDVTLDQSGLSGGSTSVVAVEDELMAGEPMDGSELVLTAPGEGNTGDVEVTFGVPVWLQDDFSDDGSLEDPAATATFGVFRGHDRIIYWREVQ